MNESTILIHNIFHMLCYAFRVLRQRNYMDILAEDFNHVEDLLAAILSRGIAMQLKQGLYKTYKENTEQAKALRGKLHPYETRRLQKMKIQKVDCSYDELSEDNELNQIIRAVSMRLIKCRDVSVKYRKALRSEMMYFQAVSDIDLSAVQWGRLQYHRNNRNYEMLMNVCRFAWQNLLPSTTAGTTKFSLFDEEGMPRLYEKFILEYYRQHFPVLRASDSQIRWDLSEDVSMAAVSQLPGMHSDITLRHGERTLIIDAKYYRHSMANYMGKQMLHSSNIYQIYTYVKNEDKDHTGNVAGMLLYARTTEEVFPTLSPVAIGGNLISARTLDLNRSFQDISFALDSIVRKYFGNDIKRVA